jgi:phage baseplate assembly protein W
MAIILGSKPVIESKEYNDYALGLTIPIRVTNYDSLNFTALNQAKSNLKNLFSTMKGERVQQPTFGTDLFSLVFDTEDSSLEERIQTIIMKEVEAWVPDVSINQIEVSMTDSQKDNNTVGISLQFVLKNTTQAGELSVQIAQ